MKLSKMTEEFLKYIIEVKKTKDFIFIQERDLPENFKSYIFGLADELDEVKLIKNLRKSGSSGNRGIDFSVLPKAFSYFEDDEEQKQQSSTQTNIINGPGVIGSGSVTAVDSSKIDVSPKEAKKSLFEKYWFPIILVIIGGLFGIYEALIKQTPPTPTPTLTSTPTPTLTMTSTPTLTETPTLVPTSFTVVSPSPTTLSTATSSPSPIPTWDNPSYFPGYCDENAYQLPCIYMPIANESYEPVAKNTLGESCKWPEIFNLNRSPTGEYRGVDPTLFNKGIFIPDADHNRPRIVPNLGMLEPPTFIPTCADNKTLPCVYIVGINGPTGYDYDSLAMIVYRGVITKDGQDLVLRIKKANLDSCPVFTKRLKPGLEIVIPMLPLPLPTP
jgi:hypothetical protein